MSEMVERVALKIAAARGFKFSQQGTAVDDLHRVFGPVIFLEARVAIEEMRIPTDKMLSVGVEKQEFFGIASVWEAMVDEALK